MSHLYWLSFKYLDLGSQEYELMLCSNINDMDVIKATVIYTVEVGSLHALRLESLKLVFQTLHKFLVNKL